MSQPVAPDGGETLCQALEADLRDCQRWAAAEMERANAAEDRLAVVEKTNASWFEGKKQELDRLLARALNAEARVRELGTEVNSFALEDVGRDRAIEARTIARCAEVALSFGLNATASEIAAAIRAAATPDDSLLLSNPMP
jgi:hypothetical protein